VITIDNHDGLAVRNSGGEIFDQSAGCAGRIEDLGHEYEVVSALRRSLLKTRREGRARFGGYVCASRYTVFLKAGHLSPECMKFGIGRQDAYRAAQAEAGKDSAQKFVGVGRDRNCRRIRKIEDCGDPRLQGWQQLVEHDPPLVPGELRSVLPTAHLGIICNVGPVVMTVRRKIDPPRVRGTEAGKVGPKIEDRHGSQKAFSPTRVKRDGSIFIRSRRRIQYAA
jgi:hypothetical protein